MKVRILSCITLLAIFAGSCTNPSNQNDQTQPIDTTTAKTSDLKSMVSIFEIPAAEFSRAVDFYQAILNVKIEKMEMPGMQMGILPYEGQVVTGVIIKAEGYQSSANGVTIYLNGGNDLQDVLDKVEKNGGKILVPKTPHADESGYFALFLDSEGNKLGLHSLN